MATLMIAAALLGAGDELTTGPVEMIAGGFKFTEGPLWVPGEGLIFSDIPADTIYAFNKEALSKPMSEKEAEFAKAVFRKPSGKSNGLTLDEQGRLIACEHWNRRVTRTEKDGSVTVVADAYEGKKFNSPNDVVVRSDGTVFFTDPPYGLEGREAELDWAGVYAVSPEGTVKLLAKDFSRPNGLAFSKDEKVLYIADTEGKHIRAFDVAADGALSNGRVFCELPGPDGMKVDVRGNVWCTASDGVRVFNPKGELLRTVEFPEVPANCAFGDDDYLTLYVTARKGCLQGARRGGGHSPHGQVRIPSSIQTGNGPPKR